MNLHRMELILSYNDSSQMLPTLDQIRDVKLMEEEEALEMGREAATIRHLFYTIIGFLLHSTISDCLYGQGPLCQDP